MEYTAELRDYKQSTLYGASLMGYIYNDTKGRFSDGTFVHTSTVQSIKDGFALTRNSVYKLVDHSPATP